MRPNLAAVFTAFGKYAEEVQEDIYRTAQLQRRAENQDREIERLRATQTEDRRIIENLRNGGPGDAAQAIAEELSKEGGGRLAALLDWRELNAQQRDDLKRIIAEVIRDNEIPF